MKKFSFIIAAGGSGSRMKGIKKQFIELDGRPLWLWSAMKACEFSDRGVFELLLVIPQGNNICEEILDSLKVPAKIVIGGSERAVSVLNGLKASECDYVMVHDAARPFVSDRLINDLMDTVSENAGVVPVLPVSDALKRIDGDNITCVDREGLYITQTPQCFPRDKLISALTGSLKAKDEAEAWERAGHELRYVKGERLNFKLTWPEDIMIAKALTEHEQIRTGLGWDVHRLVPERRLILGGIVIDGSPLGLLGHSDADILAHSVMDAVLGAAGLNDIGNLFPASDEKYKDADSMKLLSEVMSLIEAEGWHVDFVDAVIEAQVPRLNKYLDDIRQNMNRYFAFNLKFKSPEGLDDTGRGLGMTCRSVATLRRLK